MKKLSFVVSIICCFVGSVCAMEDWRLQKLPINRTEQKQYGTIIEKPHNARHDKLHTFVGAVQQLPIELQGLIIKKMCDVSGDKVYKIPLMLGLKFYNELSLLQVCPCEFGGKTFSAAQLFKLSPKRRERFLNIVKPPLYKQIGGSSNGMVTRDDYDEIIKMFPDEDGQEKLQLKVLPSGWNAFNLQCSNSMSSPMSSPCLVFSIATVANAAGMGLIALGSKHVAVGVGCALELGLLVFTLYIYRKALMENAVPVQLDHV